MHVRMLNTPGIGVRIDIFSWHKQVSLSRYTYTYPYTFEISTSLIVKSICVCSCMVAGLYELYLPLHGKPLRNEFRHNKPFLCHMRTTKAQIRWMRRLIITFVLRCLDSISIFAISLVSSAEHPVLVLTGRKPRRQILSWRGSNHYGSKQCHSVENP